METILAHALGEDVTKLAAEEKRLLLSRLLARFAHEIRNPLSSLDIHVQLLEEDLAELAPETRERIIGRFEIIHGELDRLEKIVEQFLRLARPSALDLAPVEMAPLARHVCDLLRPEATSREIELSTEIADDLPVIKADRGRVTQVLLNLLINSLQAVERRGRVVLRLSRAENDGLRLEVEDTGPGIPVERRGFIFEPYFTTKPDGTGLGLWIAQQIVTAHEGSIWAANAPAGGAILSVLLPGRTRRATDG